MQRFIDFDFCAESLFLFLWSCRCQFNHGWLFVLFFCFLHCSGIIQKRSNNCVPSIYYFFFIEMKCIFLALLRLLVSFSVAIARYRNKKFVFFFWGAHIRCWLVRGKCVCVSSSSSLSTKHNYKSYVSCIFNRLLKLFERKRWKISLTFALALNREWYLSE